MTSNPLTGLVADGLACRRQGRLLFEGLHFEVQSGQILEVCGPNGSGKTSLLRLLCGLRQPDNGQICWNGQPISDNPAEYRSALCYQGHRTGLNEDLSPIENLRLEAALFGIPASAITQALSELGLGREQGMACRHLSAGQRQRASLARLLMRSAALWILDEPIASLDQVAQTQFCQVLVQHARAGGSAIFTTHQPLSLDSENVRQLHLGDAGP